VRQLVEAILLDVYLVNQDTAREWLAGWGANVKNTPLTHSQLADRLVLAVVATLGLAEYPARLGGWFGAWSKPQLKALYANDSLQALHEVCGFFQRQRARAERPQPQPAEGPAVDASAKGQSAADAEPVNVDSLSAADVDLLWDALVERFPEAASYSAKRMARIVHGYLRILLQEQPGLLAMLADVAAKSAVGVAATAGGSAAPRKSA